MSAHFDTVPYFPYVLSLDFLPCCIHHHSAQGGKWKYRSLHYIGAKPGIAYKTGWSCQCSAKKKCTISLWQRQCIFWLRRSAPLMMPARGFRSTHKTFWHSIFPNCRYITRLAQCLTKRKWSVLVCIENSSHDWRERSSRILFLWLWLSLRRHKISLDWTELTIIHDLTNWFLLDQREHLYDITSVAAGRCDGFPNLVGTSSYRTREKARAEPWYYWGLPLSMSALRGRGSTKTYNITDT